MQENRKRVTVIETINPFVASKANPEPIKKKVAAYARVSTDDDDQKNSFDNQITEYKNRIENNNEWIFAGMYADRGISGTQIKKRENFIKMIKDAKNGKIDLILTKSISRFGRNTVDIINTVRELRDVNVAVYFEKENLYSDDPKMDFFLTLVSSIAQEESRSISENIKWSINKKFKEGRVTIIPKNFLGYEKDDKGNIIIHEDEANIVEEFFTLFLQGYSAHEIAMVANKKGYESVKGNVNWDSTSVLRILQNEKYAGNALLQKTITIDYLTHKRVVNDNIATKYYVENSHPAIVSNETFDLVQQKIKLKYANKRNRHNLNSSYPLTGVVYCDCCNRPMKRHVHGYGRPSQRVVLNCNHAPQMKIACGNKPVRNDLVLSLVNEVIDTFAKAYNLDDIVAEHIAASTNYENIKIATADLKKEITMRKTSLDNLVKEKLKENEFLDDEFNKEYQSRKEQIEKLNKELLILKKESIDFYSNMNKYEVMKNIIEPTKDFTESLIIRSLIKLIVIDKESDPIIILNTSEISVDRILENKEIIKEAKVLYAMTHYDKYVNRNITYKVVELNE